MSPQFDESRLIDLLDAWQHGRAAGREPLPEELCPNEPALQDALREHIAVARALAPGGGGNTTADLHSDAPTVVDRPLHVPGYTITGSLAKGGMGEVLAATDVALGRPVAIKTLLPDRSAAEARRRFLSEAQITARLEHPSIPPVHELGELGDGRPFLSMKLIRGRTLAEILSGRRSPSHDLGQLVAAFEQICQAVAFAHAQGVIHRDLKPANVMVGSFGEVQVMDWGLAKVLAGDPSSGEARDHDAPTGADENTRAGQVMGTPAYMAPEQARGEPVDARADVFALGGILCEILTGTPPVPGRNAAEKVTRAARGDFGETLARLGRCGAEPELVAIAVRCLAPRAADRFSTCGELAAAVSAYRAGVEERLRRAEQQRVAAEARAAEELNTRREAEARTAEQRKRRRAQAGVATLGAALLVAAVGFGWWTERKAGQDREREAAQEAQRRQSEIDLLAAQGRELEARRQRQAESHQAAVRLALQRGDSAAAIAALDAAESSGLPVTPEMRLGKARALAHLMKSARCLEELAKIDPNELGAELRAEVALLTGAMYLGTDKENQGLELVRGALANSTLPAAQREYARGLIAGNTREALEGFEAAIRIDPQHIEARGLCCIALFSLGRTDEAIRLADASRAIAPRHGIFPVVAAVANAVNDNRTEANRWVATLRDYTADPDDLAAFTALVEVMPEIRSAFRASTGAGPPPNELKLGFFFVFELPKLLERTGKNGQGLVEVFRLPPALRFALKSTVSELTASNRNQGMPNHVPDQFLRGYTPVLTFSDPAREAVARQRLTDHPEGTLHFIFALSKFGRALNAMNTNEPGWRDRMAEAAAAFEEAFRTPSLFGTQATALDMAIMVYARAGFDRPTEPARPDLARKAADLVRVRQRLTDPVAIGAWPIHFAAARDARDVGLSALTLQNWQTAVGPGGDLSEHRVWLFALTDEERALREAELVLARPGATSRPDLLEALRDRLREKFGLTPVAPEPRRIPPLAPAPRPRAPGSAARPIPHLGAGTASV